MSMPTPVQLERFKSRHRLLPLVVVGPVRPVQPAEGIRAVDALRAVQLIRRQRLPGLARWWLQGIKQLLQRPRLPKQFRIHYRRVVTSLQVWGLSLPHWAVAQRCRREQRHEDQLVPHGEPPSCTLGRVIGSRYSLRPAFRAVRIRIRREAARLLFPDPPTCFRHQTMRK